MSVFNTIRIAGSALTSERLRMDVIAENLANANTTRGVDGEPYRRKQVVVQERGGSFEDVLNGVQVAGIVEDAGPLRRVYDPGHPDADQNGYVELPNVSSVTEMVDLITATRSYEANVQIMTSARQSFTRTLDLLR
jgi:flagellar basal-body rod protein FlgC